jgi:hypothetical protein
MTDDRRANKRFFLHSPVEINGTLFSSTLGQSIHFIQA